MTARRVRSFKGEDGNAPPYGFPGPRIASAFQVSNPIHQWAEMFTVTATPPTVTYTGNLTSTLTNPVFYPYTDPAISCKPYPTSTIVKTVTTYGTWETGSTTAFIDFVTDADKFEIKATGTNPMNILVDGQLAFNTPNDGGKVWGDDHLIVFDFTTAKLRRITVILRGGYWAGINVSSHYGLYPAVSPSGPKVLGVLDSYGSVQTSIIPASLVSYAGMLLGWNNVMSNVEGGTGYLNGGTNHTGIDTFRARLTLLLPMMAASQLPDVVVTCGGINDTSWQSKAVLQAEVTAYINLLRSYLPNATLIFTGPWAPQSTLAAASGYTDVRDAIKDALALDRGPWLFIDNLTGSWNRWDGLSKTNTVPWITGTGKVGSTTGVGNADYYISSDGTHPPAVGAEYLGRRLAADIAAGLGL